MRQDGTVYLCQLQFESGRIGWDLLHWAYPAAGGGHKDCWCYQGGLGAKFTKIIRYAPFDDLLRCFYHPEELQALKAENTKLRSDLGWAKQRASDPFGYHDMGQ